jgi:Copine
VKKERPFGEVKIKLREMFERGRSCSFSLNLTDEKDKVKGELEFRHCSLRNFHTFLDLHIKNGLNLVPIIAVDFSLANLTFDEN